MQLTALKDAASVVAAPAPTSKLDIIKQLVRSVVDRREGRQGGNLHRVSECFDRHALDCERSGFRKVRTYDEWQAELKSSVLSTALGL